MRTDRSGRSDGAECFYQYGRRNGQRAGLGPAASGRPRPNAKSTNATVKHEYDAAVIWSTHERTNDELGNAKAINAAEPNAGDKLICVAAYATERVVGWPEFFIWPSRTVNRCIVNAGIGSVDARANGCQPDDGSSTFPALDESHDDAKANANVLGTDAAWTSVKCYKSRRG